MKRTKWGERIVQSDWRSKARGLYREISESRERKKRGKRKKNQKTAKRSVKH